MNRRLFHQGGISALLSFMFPWSTQAASWPNKPIRWIVPYAPGGLSDVTTRIVVQKIIENTGWQIVIENKPGANALIGSEYVARASSDGYTFLTVLAAHSVNPTLYAGTLSFDPLKSLSPVSLVGITPLLMTVSNALPVKDLKEFIAYAKANPGKLSYGSSGIGAAAHMATELFKMKTNIEMTHVPYKGATPAINDLIAGHIDCMVVGLSAAKALIEGGKLRALAITGDKRALNLPSVLTFDQAGFPLPEMKIGSWWGIVAPKGTPTEVIQELNNALNTSINSTEVKSKLRELNIEPLGGTSAEFDRWMGNEIETWSKVIKKANIQIEP